jgi:predicted glycoside hydrolase/deacetylase ChbG (UPF0249 family)
MLFGVLALYMKSKLRARGFTFPERVYGNLQSGRMSERYFLYMLDNLKAETNEIYFHPAAYSESAKLSSDDRQCLAELEALTSDQVKRRINQLGISLASYSEVDTTE